jgi:hypothetical protein
MKKSELLAGKSSFDLTVNKVPYHVDVAPFLFNDEKRFEIVVNGDEGHVFAWDPEITALRPLDDESATLPDELEKAISNRLLKIKTTG